jgi:hypothetical protein
MSQIAPAPDGELLSFVETTMIYKLEDLQPVSDILLSNPVEDKMILCGCCFMVPLEARECNSCQRIACLPCVAKNK